jgi:hypothetical protein
LVDWKPKHDVLQDPAFCEKLEADRWSVQQSGLPPFDQMLS